MLDEKTLLYYDSENDMYIRYVFRLSNDKSNDFTNRLYSMKLDYTSGNNVLVNDNTTSDLIKAFRKIFYSKVVDFTELQNLYNYDNRAIKEIIKEHLDYFFNMYTCEDISSYSAEELSDTLHLATKGVFNNCDWSERFAEEICAVKSNTHFIANSDYRFNKIKNKVYCK